MADEDVLRIIVRGQGGAEGIRALDSLLARVEAAEGVIEAAETYIHGPTSSFISQRNFDRWIEARDAYRARAALACPPQPFDPATSPGMTDLMVSPEAIDEYLAACPPPEEGLNG